MNYFDKIYQFAKQGNEAALQDLLSTNNVCIDERKQGNIYITAAFQLAKENDQKAVNLLINKFKANIKPVIQGAAMGGHFEFAHALCKVSDANIDDIAFGAAWGGHLDHAKELLNKGADIYCVIRGAAMGGYFAAADELREKQRQFREGLNLKEKALIDYDNYLKKKQLICDMAMCGHFAYGEKLEFANSSYLAQCAAIGGHMDYVEKHLNNVFSNADALNAAKSAAQGGYCEYAEKLRANKKFFLVDTSKTRTVLAYEAAKSGHREYAEKLRREGALCEEILRGAKEGSQLDYEQFLTNLMKQPVRAAAPLSNATTASGPAVNPNANLAANPISQVKTATIPSNTSEDDINILKNIINMVDGLIPQVGQLPQQIQQLQTEKNALLQLINAQQQTIEALNNNLSKQNEQIAELKRENNLQQELIVLQQRNLSQQAPQVPVPSLIHTRAPVPTTIAPSAFFQPVPLILSQGSLTTNSNQGTHSEGSSKLTHENHEYNRGVKAGRQAASLGRAKRTDFAGKNGSSYKEGEDYGNERNLTAAVQHEHEDNTSFAMQAAKRPRNG